MTDADGQPVAKGLFTGPATGENTPTFKTRATKPSEKVVTTERTSLLSKAVETFPKRRYRQERQRIRIETAERQGQTLPNGSEIRVPNRESYYRRRQAGSRGSLNEDEKQAFGVGLV